MSVVVGVQGGSAELKWLADKLEALLKDKAITPAQRDMVEKLAAQIRSGA
jgi:hypothetical protein